MRRLRAIQELAHAGGLVGVLGRLEAAAQQLEASIDQVRVQYIGLAVIADARDAAAQILAPHIRSVHPDLAGAA